MKSNSDVRPPILLDLGDGSWHYNYQVREVQVTRESGEEKAAFEYETLHVWGKPTYEKLVPMAVAEQYSPSDEISLVNKGIEDKENPEYVAYRAWVAEVKKIIKNDLGL
ncbi:MAG: hypothetical protein LBJ57_04010 [Prevotellaceae bacterium]|nr:hypothetical protein [Prevotellaceae bacterium]